MRFVHDGATPAPELATEDIALGEDRRSVHVPEVTAHAWSSCNRHTWLSLEISGVVVHAPARQTNISLDGWRQSLVTHAQDATCTPSRPDRIKVSRARVGFERGSYQARDLDRARLVHRTEDRARMRIVTDTDPHASSSGSAAPSSSLTATTDPASAIGQSGA